MKTLKFILLGWIFSFGLFSCTEKDMDGPEKIDFTKQKILTFKEKVESKNKAVGTIEVNSAVWHLEALLNFDYCEYSSSDFTKTRSKLITIPVSENGDVNFNDVVYAYKVFRDEAMLINENQKHELIDVEIIDNKSKASSKTLKLTIISPDFGHPKLPMAFLPNDYWHPIWEGGQCGSYEGQGSGLDGGKLIASHANSYIPSIFEPGYYTDIKITNFYHNEYSEYLWSDVLNNPNKACLSPSELQFWTNKLVQLGNNNIPAGKRLVRFQIEGDMIPSSYPPYLYCHYAKISYGTWHRQGEEEI